MTLWIVGVGTPTYAFVVPSDPLLEIERPDVTPYDALLLVSFGGPEKPEDVVPFLENVTAGRGIPRERLEQVGEHYYLFGGKSPINDLNRDLLAAIRSDLAEAGIDLPVYWGNRNWDPYLTDALEEMKADGVARAACFFTSAYSSWSSCRQYRENLFDADAKVPGAPVLDKLRHYFNHPGFVEPMADSVLAALATLPEELRAEAHIAYVTHSIPDSMADTSGPPPHAEPGGAYVAQHRDVAVDVTRRVAEETGVEHPQALVFCSRSGPPSVPWLEPDVNDHLEELAAAGVRAVVIVPIGFVSDHMEVVYDLDTEALATAERLGLAAARAATAATDPRFVRMVRDLLTERAAVERGEDVARVSVGSIPPMWDRCPVGCCLNARDPERPALCGEAPA
jgi:protoporphyrin/coproporphyrin ferrochelatase